jgi:glycosyltransferase involved in cell wall biosynthesis
MPVVSVIIPIYNARAYLGETLKSVQDQTFKDWECIIVENGSSDESGSSLPVTAASP